LTTKKHSLSEIEKEIEIEIEKGVEATTVDSTTLSDEIEETSTRSNDSTTDPTDPTAIEAEYSQTGRHFLRTAFDFSVHLV
jgi:hypothetical protein